MTAGIGDLVIYRTGEFTQQKHKLLERENLERKARTEIENENSRETIKMWAVETTRIPRHPNKMKWPSTLQEEMLGDRKKC